VSAPSWLVARWYVDAARASEGRPWRPDELAAAHRYQRDAWAAAAACTLAWLLGGEP
jgi:hypothetical protein